MEIFQIDGCRDDGGCHCSMSATSSETGETLWGDAIPLDWVKARDAEAALSAALARAEAAERLAVWAVRGLVGITRDGKSIVNDDYTMEVDFDGTDADLLRALKEASGVE